MKKGLDPIVDENTEVLILGSFPGEESLQKQQYYADPRNDFWKLIGSAIGGSFEGIDYQKKVEKLKQNGIGLWDVYERAERAGSTDSDIKDGKVNDFSILKNCPDLKMICFNGEEAASIYREERDIQFEVETKVLLSSSAANRKRQEERQKQWASKISRYID